MIDQKEFDNWVKWRQKKGCKPMTGGQYKFARFCFDNWDIVSEIGDRVSIFQQIRDFIRDSRKSGYILTKEIKKSG